MRACCRRSPCSECFGLSLHLAQMALLSPQLPTLKSASPCCSRPESSHALSTDHCSFKPRRPVRECHAVRGRWTPDEIARIKPWAVGVGRLLRSRAAPVRTPSTFLTSHQHKGALCCSSQGCDRRRQSQPSGGSKLGTTAVDLVASSAGCCGHRKCTAPPLELKGRQRQRSYVQSSRCVALALLLRGDDLAAAAAAAAAQRAEHFDASAADRGSWGCSCTA